MNNASFPAQMLDLLSQNYRHFLCFHTPFLGGIEKSAAKSSYKTTAWDGDIKYLPSSRIFKLGIKPKTGDR